MSLTPKEKILHRILEKRIYIKESFLHSVLSVEMGGLTGYQFGGESLSDKGEKYSGVITIPEFSDANDTVQAIDLSWALAGYELYICQKKRVKIIAELLGNQSYFYQKILWQKAEEICVQEGFMDARPKWQIENLKGLFRIEDSERKKKNLEEKQRFRYEFEYRKNLLLQKAKAKSFSLGKEIPRVASFIVKSYVRVLFILLFCALLDKAALSVPIIKGLGNCTLPELALGASRVTFVFLIFNSIWMLIKKRCWI
ncbi:hypothetical protein [Bacillus cereus]